MTNTKEEPFSDDMLFDWVTKNAEFFDLRVHWISSVPEVLPDHRCCSVEISFKNERFTGAGIAECEEKAFAKAITEAVEHIVCCHHRLQSSSGVAGNTQRSLAVKKSVHELIERDRFFCHYLTKSSLRWLPEQTLYEKSRFSGLQAAINGRQWHMKCGVMQPSKQGVGVFFVFFNNCGQIISAISFADDLFLAIQHGVQEGLRASLHYLSPTQPQTAMSTIDFLKIDRHRPEDHIRLGLAHGSINQIFAAFGAPDNPIKTDSPCSLQAEDDRQYIRTENLSLPPELSDCPLYFTRAVSEWHQPLFFGPTTPEKVHLDRLSAFSNRIITYEGVNQYPHMFG